MHKSKGLQKKEAALLQPLNIISFVWRPQGGYILKTKTKNPSHENHNWG